MALDQPAHHFGFPAGPEGAAAVARACLDGDEPVDDLAALHQHIRAGMRRYGRSRREESARVSGAGRRSSIMDIASLRTSLKENLLAAKRFSGSGWRLWRARAQAGVRRPPYLNLRIGPRRPRGSTP